MIYEWSKHVYDFRRFWTLRSFGEGIFNGKITINEADRKETNVLDVIQNFKNKVRQKSNADKAKKRNAFESGNALYQGRELIINAFKGRIFPLKLTQGKGLKMLAL